MQGAMAGCTSVSFTARCEDYRRHLCRSPATQGPFTTWLGWGLIRLADVGACVQEEAQHALRGSAIGAPGPTATPRGLLRMVVSLPPRQRSQERRSAKAPVGAGAPRHPPASPMPACNDMLRKCLVKLHSGYLPRSLITLLLHD